MGKGGLLGVGGFVAHLARSLSSQGPFMGGLHGSGTVHNRTDPALTS